MRKIVAIALCVFGLSAFAEQLDHWEFDTEKGNTITDGEWTFTVSRRSSQAEVAEGTFGLWLLNCTAAPSSLSTLDFGKSVAKCEYDGKKYAITNLGSYGDWLSSDQKLLIERLVLPTAVPFVIDKDFSGCTNLMEVTPFLPSCMDTLDSRGVFMNCSNLTNALVFTGSNLGESTNSWDCAELFKNCAKIPSADLSESTITALRRDAFANCTSLAWVKLPPTFREFGIPDDPSNLLNRNPFGGTMSVKLYITATSLPKHTMDIPEVTSIEILSDLDAVDDEAFSKAQYSNLTEIKFYGKKPATIGENLFAGQTEKSITVYVPRDDGSVLEEWKTVADGGVITSRSGTWTSGTTQNIRSYRLKATGSVIIVHP